MSLYPKILTSEFFSSTEKNDTFVSQTVDAVKAEALHDNLVIPLLLPAVEGQKVQVVAVPMPEPSKEMPEASPLTLVPLNPMPTYPMPLNPMPIYPLTSNPMPTYPMPLNPMPIHPVTSNPMPTYPMPLNPMPTYPVTLNPMPAYAVPFNSTPFYSVPSNPMAGASFPFRLTAFADIQEFYRHLCILSDFFQTIQLRYWLVGGSLLGQVREQDFIKWDTNNDIGVLVENEADGQRLFETLKHYLLSNKEFANSLVLWRSTHGLKLISKPMSHIGTDIYFYCAQDKEKLVLMREKSRKQWHKDYFLMHEIESENWMPFGPLKLAAPSDPHRYLKTLYGNDYLTHARLGSFDHFKNGPRIGPKVTINLEKIKAQAQ